MQYKEDFEKAIAFSRRIGSITASLPVKLAQNDRLITQESWNLVEKELHKLGVTSLKNSASQCLKWSHALKPTVEKALGVEIMLTVGQVYFQERPVFNPTLEVCERWYFNGMSHEDMKNGINIHAWYTLPNLEIMDLTLLSSVAEIKKMPELEGHLIVGFPGELGHHRYVPIVLGNKFAEEVSLKSPIRLLVENVTPKELNSYPIGITITEV